ncbi:Transcriptional regulator CRZ2 [Spathaspora sp. JA1]|nr:Transcriptional regulator CRZ2 [Spathaspora sp. JA1]
MFNYNSYYNANSGMNQADPNKQPPQTLQPQNSHQQQQVPPNMQYVQAQSNQSMLQKQHVPPLPQQNQSLPSIFANLPQQDSVINSSGAPSQFLAYSSAVPQLPPTPFAYDYSNNQYNSTNSTNSYSSQPRPYSSLPIPQAGAYGAYYQYNSPANAASGSSLPVLPSNSQRYPLSPLTVQSDREANNGTSKSSTGSLKGSSTSPPDIDYSSLVSYTISRSIRRKRRRKATDATPLNPVESFPCEVCNKVFQKHYNLKSHMKTHSTDKPYKCSHCFKTFARSHDKKRHELLHNGIKNFKCEGYLQDGVTKWGCGKKFARSDALSRHFRTETGWLCIRPLMDEAKRLEEAGISSTISVPVAAGAIIPNSSVSSMTTPTTSSNTRSPNGEEYYDNSSIIKKLIQSK